MRTIPIEEALRELERVAAKEATMIEETEIELGKAIEFDVPFPGHYSLRCPACDSSYQRVDGSGSAALRADGEAMALAITGECGSRWELCLQFHKGETKIFARMVESCDELPSL